MANLTLVYGLRLLPSDEVEEVGAATIKLKNGRDAQVTMHILEGGKEESVLLRITAVYLKRDGQWRAIVEQATNLAAEE